MRLRVKVQILGDVLFVINQVNCRCQALCLRSCRLVFRLITGDSVFQPRVKVEMLGDVGLLKVSS